VISIGGGGNEQARETGGYQPFLNERSMVARAARQTFGGYFQQPSGGNWSAAEHVAGRSWYEWAER